MSSMPPLAPEGDSHKNKPKVRWYFRLIFVEFFGGSFFRSPRKMESCIAYALLVRLPQSAIRLTAPPEEEPSHIVCCF